MIIELTKNLMGQAYCIRLCGENDLPVQNTLSNLFNELSDEPNPKFAKRVKQHIELHPKIKSVYLQYRTQHPAEKIGVKLNLYYLFQFAAYYQGEWKNGLPNGFGRVIYDDGSIYQGCFNQGIAECNHALFIKHDGSFYRGCIKNNKAVGYGQLSAYKIFYKGGWKDDLPNGKAREVYNNNSFFEGNFVNGVKQGYGYYKWNDSDYYKGTFHHNQIDGKGELTTKEYTYLGSFKKGKKQGEGRYIDHCFKFTYLGTFEDNQPKGFGELTYKDGTVFSGIFAGFQKRKGVLKFLGGQEHQVDTFNEEDSIQILEDSFVAA